MPSRFPTRSSGLPVRDLAAIAALALLAAACNYGFHGGGGFPSHIRTIYIEPFENDTPQFDLEQQLFTKLLEDIPRSLGVRPAGREAAHAVLRGRITRYDDAAQSYRPGQQTTGAVDVLEHQVRINVSVELIDIERNVILWDSQSVMGQGVYRLDNETEERGRLRAIENIVRQIIDGAQSQW